MPYNLPIDKITEGVTGVINTVLPTTCSINNATQNIVWIFLIFLIWKYKDLIMIKFFSVYSKKGYIRVIMRLKNMQLQPILIKLDTMSNFKHKLLKDKLYHMVDMYEYIIGYDLRGFPTFFYDEEFILPWHISTTAVTDKIKHDLGLQTETEIKAITMRLDPAILKTVYSKKLLDDIYNASVKKINWKIILIIGGCLLALYFFKDKLIPVQAAKTLIPFMIIFKRQRKDKQ
jgi:hypothetical protein